MSPDDHGSAAWRLESASPPTNRAACTPACTRATRTKGDGGLDGPGEEAARRLILRITELTGGGKPDWHGDESVFEAPALRHVIGFIDEQVRISPTVTDVAPLVGPSPSHFAKKSRQSTGLSLHRFVNRRRILRSLDMLNDRSLPLAHVALDLGFSSQSHFTHLFAKLTGMTPAMYRKRCRRNDRVGFPVPRDSSVQEQG